jgi:multidrug transporter EmrE-like cation transporter
MSPTETTAGDTTAGKPTARGRLGLWALCALLPVLGLAYQVAAKETALALDHTHFGLDWFADLFHQPWAAVLIAFEIASFAAWMTVLARMRLSAAFPLTALGYVLIIGVSWAVFHEPASAPQVVGGAVILAGVWLIGRGEQDAA